MRAAWRVLSAVAVLLCAVGVAIAAPASEQEQIQRLEAYLNGIKSLQSRFYQASTTGEEAAGTLYLDRPGRLRIEYDPPSPMLIVADGSFLVTFDRKLQQATYLPLGQTPAAVLLDERVRLDSGDFRVAMLQADADSVRATIERRGSPAEGRLALVFTESPLRLHQWEVTDAQGIVTAVVLDEPRFGVPLKRELFEFRDPRFFEQDLR
jgi:outer membrane lipoprotein-sorting protein